MILVLSLGIGSTTGVFALVDELVLRSLPVRQPERLVYFTRPSFSYPVFTEVRTRSAGIFSQLFAWNLETVNVRWFTRLESTEVLMASGEFYSTLGLTPSIGRLLTPDDDRIGGTASWPSSATAAGGAASAPTPASSDGSSPSIAVRSRSSGSRREASSASRPGCRPTSPSR